MTDREFLAPETPAGADPASGLPAFADVPAKGGPEGLAPGTRVVVTEALEFLGPEDDPVTTTVADVPQDQPGRLRVVWPDSGRGDIYADAWHLAPAEEPTPAVDPKAAVAVALKAFVDSLEGAWWQTGADSTEERLLGYVLEAARDALGTVAQ